MAGRRERVGARAAVAWLVLAHVLALTCSEASAQSAPRGQRVCKPRIDWSETAPSRRQAQQRAVEGWAAAATAAHGEAFSRWAVAGIARVNCALTADGHRCRAAASPCRDVPLQP